MKRRALLGCIAAVPVLTAFARAPKYILQRASSRVIIDNDFAGDPDGLIALAHQLLSPKTRTVLITASPLDPKLAGFAGIDPARTAASGARVAREILKQLGLRNAPPVVTGAEGFAGGEARPNAAARAIVSEAMRDDPLPLVLTCGGPLTNVAAALRLNPAIAGRMTLVWIGGSSAPDGGVEYNLSTDIEAARFVLEETALPVWQIQEAEYKRFQISVAELSSSLRPISPAAQWLYDLYQQLPPFVQLGGSVTFGDSPMVSLTALAPELTPFTTLPVRRILDDSRYGEQLAGRQVRVYHSIDVRLNFSDFIAQMRLNGANG
ncbi:nucleoside hydrolase [Massilia niastensis]|uniref:nucleoside hydrolase n=1 Tax=Massilia niastensis TaxID=544911 RepID=UPI000363D4AC|nr:nucleoside hydrolase [Massilia niastensis]